VVIFPPEKDTRPGGLYEGEISEIMEKPANKHEQVGLKRHVWSVDNAETLIFREDG
jgi:hypothetical protein